MSTQGDEQLDFSSFLIATSLGVVILVLCPLYLLASLNDLLIRNAIVPKEAIHFTFYYVETPMFFCIVYAFLYSFSGDVAILKQNRGARASVRVLLFLGMLYILPRAACWHYLAALSGCWQYLGALLGQDWQTVKVLAIPLLLMVSVGCCGIFALSHIFEASADPRGTLLLGEPLLQQRQGGGGFLAACWQRLAALSGFLPSRAACWERLAAPSGFLPSRAACWERLAAPSGFLPSGAACWERLAAPSGFLPSRAACWQRLADLSGFLPSRAACWQRLADLSGFLPSGAACWQRLADLSGRHWLMLAKAVQRQVLGVLLVAAAFVCCISIPACWQYLPALYGLLPSWGDQLLVIKVGAVLLVVAVILYLGRSLGLFVALLLGRTRASYAVLAPFARAFELGRRLEVLNHLLKALGLQPGDEDAGAVVVTAIVKQLQLMLNGVAMVVGGHWHYERFRDILDSLAAPPEFEDRDAAVAWVISRLRLSGGYWPKFMQVLAVRDDVFTSRLVLDELGKSLEEGVAESVDEVKALFKSQKVKVDSLKQAAGFAPDAGFQFQKAFHAGSVGQVHELINPHGGRHALKITFPKWKAKFEVDFELLENALLVLPGATPKMLPTEIAAIIKTVLKSKERVLGEFDLEKEGAAQEEAAQLCETSWPAAHAEWRRDEEIQVLLQALFGADGAPNRWPQVRVPHVQWSEHSNVLLMDYADGKLSGTKLTDGGPPDQDMEKLLEVFVTTYVPFIGWLLLCADLAHVDPHPGNFRFNRDTQELWVYDWGSHARLSKFEQKYLCDLVWDVAAHPDDADRLKECIRCCCGQRASEVPHADAVIRGAFGLDAGEQENGKLAASLDDLLEEVTGEMVPVVRAVTILGGIFKKLQTSLPHKRIPTLPALWKPLVRQRQ